MEDELTTLICL